jgi:ubiquinone/menaquinone biosynthesis C-methylase UbiE
MMRRLAMRRAGLLLAAVTLALGMLIRRLAGTSGVEPVSESETVRVQRYYDAFASRYDTSMGLVEKLLFGGGRHWVCSQASGDVLELAAGTGRNLPYYSPDVRLTGIDLSREMLDVARQRAAELGRDVDLRFGDAQALEFPDQQFDTVIATLALCSIPDERRALSEAMRVLRPGGRLLLLEHVKSDRWPVRVIQQLLNPLSVRYAADHLLREPGSAVWAAGFEIEHDERATWGIVERLRARKPAGD